MSLRLDMPGRLEEFLAEQRCRDKSQGMYTISTSNSPSTTTTACYQAGNSNSNNGPTRTHGVGACKIKHTTGSTCHRHCTVTNLYSMNLVAS